MLGIKAKSLILGIKAYRLARQFKQAREARVMFCALIMLLNEHPDLTAKEYLEKVEQIANKRGFIA